MKSKAFLLALVLCFWSFTLVAVPAYGNHQKIYDIDSDLYEAISLLYISQGRSLPSATGPYSQAELESMLKGLDPGSLDGAYAETYRYVVSQLDTRPKQTMEGMGFSIDIDANLEAYAHTNTDTFVGRDSWVRGFMEQKPMLSLSLETWPADHFYGYSEFSLGNTYTMENGFGSTALSTNLLVLPPATIDDLDFNMPYRAFVAAGGDHWTFQLGRDRLSWGAGQSGNLFVGDNLKYHNMARFTAFGERFKYTFVTSFFPHPKNYLGDQDVSDDADDDDYNAIAGDEQEDILSGLNMFMAHRLEWRMFENRVGLTLTEGIMYQSEENLLDLRVLNPAMIFHDLYIRSNSNSLLGLEIDYTPIRGLNLYGQAVVDEFSLPGEAVPSETASNYPITFGFLAGARAVFPVQNLVGHVSLEFAHTDPFLYLRYQTESGAAAADDEHPYDTYSLNYVGVIREFTVHDGMFYNAEFIGYKYGGDAIVLNLNGGVKRYGRWNLEANGFFMLHGTFDIYTMWSQIGAGTGVPYDISTPTDDHPTENYNDEDAKLRDSVSRTLVLGVNGSYMFSSSLDGFAQVDYIDIVNFGNRSGVRERDVQLTCGISYHL